MTFRTDEDALRFLNDRISADTLYPWDARTINNALAAAAKRRLDAEECSRLWERVFRLLVPPSMCRICWPEADSDLDAGFDRALCRDPITDDGVRPVRDGDQYLGGSNRGH
jgi:hypothetical protein